MELEMEVGRLAKIREELIHAAASMPKEDEVKQIIWEILDRNSEYAAQPVKQVTKKQRSRR